MFAELDGCETNIFMMFADVDGFETIVFVMFADVDGFETIIPQTKLALRGSYLFCMN